MVSEDASGYRFDGIVLAGGSSVPVSINLNRAMVDAASVRQVGTEWVVTAPGIEHRLADFDVTSMPNGLDVYGFSYEPGGQRVEFVVATDPAPIVVAIIAVAAICIFGYEVTALIAMAEAVLNAMTCATPPCSRSTKVGTDFFDWACHVEIETSCNCPPPPTGGSGTVVSNTFVIGSGNIGECTETYVSCQDMGSPCTDTIPGTSMTWCGRCLEDCLADRSTRPECSACGF